MAIESLYAESQVSTTILRKRAYLDGYAARLQEGVVMVIYLKK